MLLPERTLLTTGWGRLDFAPDICYTSGEEKSQAAVGATGFDGALEGLELREEVVGHLSKLPAKPKCRYWHENGCLIRVATSSRIRPRVREGRHNAGWSASRPGATPARPLSPGWVGA